MIKRLYRLNGVNFEHILAETFKHKKLYIKKHLWKYDYFITKIINQMIFNKSAKYYKLSTKLLNRQFGECKLNGKTKELYSIIREELKQVGIIKFHTTGESDFTNRVFKRSAYYKITNEYRCKGYKQVNYLTDFIKLKMEEVKEYTGLYRKLKDNLSIISIDYGSAIKFCNDALKNKLVLRPKKDLFVWNMDRKMNDKIYSCWITAINAIHDGEYNFNVDLKGTGRVFNFLSCLPKELRGFVRINNKPIIELDIANCQPLLFVSLLDEVKDNQDVVFYKELCEAGEFYNFVRKLLIANDCEAINEKTFKVDFFAKIFFSTEKKNYKWRQIFDKEFPSVSLMVSKLKKDDYKDLACMLCRVESDLMINKVSRTLIDYNIYEFFTIHDAIYTTADNVEVVKKVVTEAFKELDLKPNIK